MRRACTGTLVHYEWVHPYICRVMYRRLCSVSFELHTEATLGDFRLFWAILGDFGRIQAMTGSPKQV